MTVVSLQLLLQACERAPHGVVERRTGAGDIGFLGKNGGLVRIFIPVDIVNRTAVKKNQGDAADPSKSVEQLVSDKDSSFRIHVALHAMEEPFREVFELRVFGELSFREVGAVFGKTENWARVTYHRARLKLQERMGIQ